MFLIVTCNENDICDMCFCALQGASAQRANALWINFKRPQYWPLLQHFASPKILLHLVFRYSILTLPIAPTGIDNTLLAIVHCGPSWTVAIAGIFGFVLEGTWESVLHRERRGRNSEMALVPTVISTYFLGILHAAEAGALP